MSSQLSWIALYVWLLGGPRAWLLPVCRQSHPGTIPTLSLRYLQTLRRRLVLQIGSLWLQPRPVHHSVRSLGRHRHLGFQRPVHRLLLPLLLCLLACFCRLVDFQAPEKQEKLAFAERGQLVVGHEQCWSIEWPRHLPLLSWTSGPGSTLSLELVVLSGQRDSVHPRLSSVPWAGTL